MGNRLLLVLVLFTFFANIYCFFRTGAKTKYTQNYVRGCKTDKDPPQIYTFNYFKHNRTHFATTANWTVLEPFDKCYKLHIEIQKWGDGGWKRNFLNIDRDDACGNLHLFYGSVWRATQIAFGMKPKCPIETGFYKMEGYVPNTQQGEDNPIAVLPGKFLILVHILKHRKITICAEYEIELSESYD